MIFSLEGKVIFKGTSYIVIEVGGIGYRVFVGPRTMKDIPAQGSNLFIYTLLYTRETDIELYGFITIAELEFFETLNKIPGIGPKSALGIINVAPLDTLKRAIASGQTTYLTKVSGIGRKTAEKIVLELRDKLGKGITKPDGMESDEEVLDALEALGYSAREARGAIYKIPGDVTGTEKRVKAALKILGRQS